jgi:hypothetical protein
MLLEQASLLLSDWIKNKPVEVAVQQAALEHYGKFFKPDNLQNITEEGFKRFLVIENNKHWKGIHRHPKIYADMDRLKTALKVLLDECQSIQVRLDNITDKSGPLYIKGLGRAVLTPILMCVYPDKYAVYNRISEEALTRLGRNKRKVTDTFGKRYVAINEACNQISDEIKQPLSLVDAMFSFIVHGSESPPVSPDMQPYLRLIKAGMQDRDTTPHLEEIAAIPLEKRYVWRVASALKWAFADLETVSVNVDRETLSKEDLKKLIELLRLRPMQLCIFLKALLGEEAMERLMKDGIEAAKREE